MLMQMSSEETLFAKLRLMNQFELLSLKVALTEAMQSTEFQIRLAAEETLVKPQSAMHSTVNTMESGFKDPNSTLSGPTNGNDFDNTLPAHLTLEINRGPQTNVNASDPEEKEKELTHAQIAQEARRELVSLL